MDAANALLWRGDERVALPPKPFGVLCYLVERAGDLVTKEELLDAVWSSLNVTESSLSVSIKALRSALGDDPRAPRYIETVTRRGYRFVAPVTIAPFAWTEPTMEPLPPLPSADPPLARWWVGRGAMIEAADNLLDLVIAGQRQVVFVTGEAGIGKTTFVEMLMQRMATRGVDILSGHCVEHFGADEAFHPLIEALEDRCARPDGHRLVAALRDRAPTWLAQMPKLLEGEDATSLRNAVFGTTRERMLREFCEVVEITSAHRPVAIVVEDLHWSDFATLDVLSRLARRDRSACVMVLATYRPIDVLIDNHPVRRIHQELQIHGRCTELALDTLSAFDVERYLELRFGGAELARALGATVYRRTRGQPLFVVSLVADCVARGAIVQAEGHWELATREADPLGDGIPNDLHTMITYQIDRLNTADQRLLEAASAVGAEFSAAVVAGAVGLDPAEVEQSCEALVRSGRILVGAGLDEWPDGTVAGRYSFQHALYQEVLYQRLAPAQRVSTHCRLGERLEAGYGSRAGEVAPILALHFENGRNFSKAVHYLGLAAANSARRFASQEATIYLTRALDLVDHLPIESRAQARPTLLHRRSWIRRSSGDFLGSIDDLRIMITFAEASGDRRSEVHGLLDFSRFCLLTDLRDCLPAAERALAIGATLDDPALTTLLHANVANLRMLVKGWREEDAAVCRRTIPTMRDARDFNTGLRRCATEMIFEYWRSNYRDASIAAGHGRELAHAAGDQYVSVLFMNVQAGALLHLGEWGDLLEYVTLELETADNNANRHAGALCRLAIAWLHAEALDFEGARELCESGLDTAVEANPFHFAIGRTQFASVLLGLGDYPSARTQIDLVIHRFEADDSAMDVLARLHFYQNFSRYWLEIGDLAKARDWATRLYEFSAPAPERTYLALSHRLFAKIALAEGDHATARTQIDKAVAIVDQAELPLAAWRVYATAAELHETTGDLDRAEEFHARTKEVIDRLAASLPENSPLRETLLARYPSEGRR